MMWMGEQITEKGIGKSISLIIFIGIINWFPFAILDEIRLIDAGTRNIVIEIAILAFMGFVIVVLYLLLKAQEEFPFNMQKELSAEKFMVVSLDIFH